MPLVAVVMGSESDRDFMSATVDTLDSMGISNESFVMSAHRTPELVRELAQTADVRGIEVFVAGAGFAAHLPGVIASWTYLPVIGVPLPTSDLRGVDSLMAIVQMPAGIAVATVGIGKSGATNAAFLAAQILGLKHEKIREAYTQHRQRLASGQK